MPTSIISSPRTTLARRALLALSCAFALALVSSATAQTATLQPLAAEKAPALPVTTSFKKLADGTVPPYVLEIKNTSHATLKVSGKVLLAVVHHNADKARKVAEQAIDAGKTMTIPELAADDKVTLTAEGFAPLELTVP